MAKIFRAKNEFLTIFGHKIFLDKFKNRPSLIPAQYIQESCVTLQFDIDSFKIVGVAKTSKFQNCKKIAPKAFIISHSGSH